MAKVIFKYTGDFSPPIFKTAGAAGIDLFNNSAESVSIEPGKSAIISTGFEVQIPEGYVGLLFARSSLGFKFDCTLANSVGVIDSDYRGEVKAKITNHSDKTHTIEPNEGVCQLVVLPYVTSVNFEQTEGNLNETERGTGGFGSTGRI